MSDGITEMHREESNAIDAHYAKLPIQPIHFSMVNELDVMQHTIIKYVVRHKDKGGKRDLLAARHMLDMYIDYIYNQEPQDD